MHRQEGDQFACPFFTVSLAELAVAPADVRSLTVAGHPLARYESDGATLGPLPAGSWTV